MDYWNAFQKQVSEALHTAQDYTTKTLDTIAQSAPVKTVSEYTSKTINQISNSETVKNVSQFANETLDKISNSEAMKTVSEYTDKTFSAVEEFLGLDTQQRKIVVLGFQSAGKTTLMNQWKGVKIKNMNKSDQFIDLILNEIDAKNSDQWKQAITGTVSGIVFVVDSTDKEKFEDVKKSLKEVIEHAKAPVLIMCSKQDLEGAVKEDELLDILELKGLTTGKEVRKAKQVKNEEDEKEFPAEEKKEEKKKQVELFTNVKTSLNKDAIRWLVSRM